MGDFNIDLLQFNKHNTTNDFVNNKLSHSFLPVITRPTRLSFTSATIIIIITDIADHFGTFYMTKKEHNTKKEKHQIRRQYNERNMNKCCDLVKQQAYDTFII
jgi:hypothetical protein